MPSYFTSQYYFQRFLAASPFRNYVTAIVNPLITSYILTVFLGQKTSPPQVEVDTRDTTLGAMLRHQRDTTQVLLSGRQIEGER